MAWVGFRQCCKNWNYDVYECLHDQIIISHDPKLWMWENKPNLQNKWNIKKNYIFIRSIQVLSMFDLFLKSYRINEKYEQKNTI